MLAVVIIALLVSPSAPAVNRPPPAVTPRAPAVRPPAPVVVASAPVVRPSAPVGCHVQGTVKVTRAEGSGAQAPTVVVYVKKVQWDPPARAYTVHQLNMQFSEKLIVLVKHDQVKFVNDDKMDHSVFTSTSPDEGFAFGVSAKPQTGERSLMVSGAYHVQCDIHPKMQMDILVVQNPFFARVRDDGHWEIADPLPPGSNYTLVAWEPHGGEATVPLACNSAEVTAPDISLQEKPAPPTLHRDRTPHLPRVGY